MSASGPDVLWALLKAGDQLSRPGAGLTFCDMLSGPVGGLAACEGLAGRSQNVQVDSSRHRRTCHSAVVSPLPKSGTSRSPLKAGRRQSHRAAKNGILVTLSCHQQFAALRPVRR